MPSRLMVSRVVNQKILSVDLATVARILAQPLVGIRDDEHPELRLAEPLQ